MSGVMRKLLIVFVIIVGCFFANISNESKDCSNSNCSSKRTISPYIKDYETLQYGREELLQQHSRAKRSLDSEEGAQVTWKFRAFNNDFHVILKRDTNTFPANVEIVDVNEKPLTSLNTSHIYYGHLVDEPHTSYVHGSISSHDGVFEGSIRSHLRGLYYIEHAKRFEPLREVSIEVAESSVDDSSSVHSVIYKDEHIELEPYASKEGHLGACGITPEVSDWMSSIQNSATSGGNDDDGSQDNHVDANFQSNQKMDGDIYRYDTDFQPKNLFTKNHHLFSASANIFHGETRNKRSVRKESNEEIRNTCSLSIQTDPLLWRHIRKGFADHSDPNKKREIDEKTREEILSLIAQHVTAVNYIYRDTKFDGRFQHRNIKFEVQRIKIDDDASCVIAKTTTPAPSKKVAPPRSGNLPYHGFYHNRKRLLMQAGIRGSGSSNLLPLPPTASANAQETNSFCVENIDVSNFLNLHSLRNHEVFCLAYVFTYRDFTGGTLGLAWVASASGASGGICEKYKTYTETVGGLYQSTKRSLNTGIITFVNYNTRVPPKVSQLTLAHEIGHNFGSPHDFPSECRPGGLSGNYIMFASATSGDRPNNSKFSSCSIGNISNVLDAIENSRKSNCFTASAGAFCGNKIVEAGEECDCGYDRKECLDRCCYPRIFESDEIRLNETALGCKRRKGSQCSPSQGPCCSHSCDLIPAYPRIVCRKETDCSDASFCNGTSPECPHPKAKRNKTRCNNDTQLCIDGECSASICLEWNLVECFLASTPPSGLPSGVPVTYSVKYDKRKLCELACQNGTDVRTCRSTSEFAHLVGLPPGGISLRPGSPCDNFQGYCDIFLRCRAVDAEGPLVRLKNLLLNKETLDQITQWMTTYWWGFVMISLAFIVVMGLFIKCCAVYTPSSNPKRPPARRLPDTISRPMSTFKRMKHYTSHERRSGSSVRVNVASNSPTSEILEDISDIRPAPVSGRSRSSSSNVSSSGCIVDIRRHRPRNEHRSSHRDHHLKSSHVEYSRTHVPSTYVRAYSRNSTGSSITNATPNANPTSSSSAVNIAASTSAAAAAAAHPWNTKV